MIRDLAFVLVVFATNVIQAITGFAGTLLAMPPSIQLIGVSPARTVLNAVALISCISILIKGYKQINWPELIRILCFMIIGTGCGMLLFKLCPLNFLLTAYGIMIIVIALQKLRGHETTHLSTAAGCGILFAAGLIHGMFVSGGALLVVYAAMKLPDKHEFRSTMAAVWVVLNSFMLITHVCSGEFTKHGWILLLLCVVPVLLSTKIGTLLLKRIDQKTFLKITYVLLLISGLLAIV